MIMLEEAVVKAAWKEFGCGADGSDRSSSSLSKLIE